MFLYFKLKLFKWTHTPLATDNPRHRWDHKKKDKRLVKHLTLLCCVIHIKQLLLLFTWTRLMDGNLMPFLNCPATCQTSAPVSYYTERATHSLSFTNIITCSFRLVTMSSVLKAADKQSILDTLHTNVNYKENKLDIISNLKL